MADYATQLVGRLVPSDREDPRAEGDFASFEPVDRANHVHERLPQHVVGVANPARSEVSVDRWRRLSVELTPRPFRARARCGENGVERFTERDRRLPSRGAAE